MRLRDLGTLTIETDGVEIPPGGAKPSAILAVLIVNANQRVSIGSLMEAVWGDRVSDRTPSTLESHIWRLRRVLEPNRAAREAPSVLINDTGGYRLLVSPDQVDSLRFAQLAEEIRDLLAAGEGDRALRRSEEALALWRGRPYEGHSDGEWAAAAVARLDEIHAQVQERHVDVLLAVGQSERALAELEPLLAAMPFRERLWAQRMLALYRSGRVEESLQTYQRARGVLDEEIGIEPGPELRELHARVLAQDPGLSLTAATPPRPSARAVEVQLPSRVSPLIGRAADVIRLTALSASNPMVTIAGAAGCGKTRLAIEVARTAAPQFREGVWFIDLNEVDSADLVVDVVISTIGFAPPPVGTALDALRAYTNDRRMLLVFDNCEHLLSGVAVVAEALLGAGSECAVLATSREPVGLDGEIIWTLGPLALTAEDTSKPDDSPAVALFLARLAAADPTVALDDADLGIVHAICVAVDGLPLALELAAARIRSYSLAEIEAQVRTDPSSLTRIGRGPSDHRQTLRSAIEWSHRLMSPSEQVVHRRLSVLPGEFTRSTAIAVAGTTPVPAADVPEVLALLVHRSMLTSMRSARPGGPSMFSQLATVRAHAGHLLAGADEADQIAQRRDDWVRALMTERPRLSRPDTAGWYRTVDDAFPTIRATLQNTHTDRPHPSAAWILGQLSMYWYFRSRMIEGQRWLDLGEASTTGADPVESILARLSHAGVFAMRGRFDLVTPHIEAVRVSIRQAPAEMFIDIGENLSGLALAASSRSEVGLVGELAAMVGDLAERSGDPDLATDVDGLSCLAGMLSTDLETSSERAQGIYDRAVAQGNLLGAWMACGVQTTVALRLQRPEEGMVWSDRTIAVNASLGAKDGSFFLETRANFMALAQRHEDAVRMYAASRIQVRRAGMTWPRRPISDQLLQSMREALSRADFERCWRDGERLTAAEALGSFAVGSAR